MEGGGRETESITKMWPQGKYGLNCGTHADTHSLSLSLDSESSLLLSTLSLSLPLGLNMLCGQEVDNVGNEKAALA